MLYGEPVIIAEHAQRRNELFPPLGAMAVAAGAEDPTPIALIGVVLGVEHTGPGQVRSVYLRVFCVHVAVGVPQHANPGDGMGSLPTHITAPLIASKRAPPQHPPF